MSSIQKDKKNILLRDASIIQRAMAFAIDWYVGGVLVSLPVIAILFKVNPGQDAVLELRSLPFKWALLALGLAFIVAFLFYVYLPYRWKGQTLGKRWVKIKITDINGCDISFSKVIKRQVIGIFLIEGSMLSITPLIWQVVFYGQAYLQQRLTWIYYVLTLVSVLLLFISKKRIMLHDAIAKTRVLSI